MALRETGCAGQADAGELAPGNAGADVGAQLVLQSLKFHLEDFANSNTCTLVICLKQYFC
jgi:hypothetical protein